MRRRGRPGLIGSAVRTAGRTAIVVGTANAMTGGRGRAAAAAAQPTRYVEPAPAPSGGLDSEAIARLKELADLKAAGVLTDAEFEQQKARILNG